MELSFDLNSIAVAIFVVDVEPGPRFRIFGMNGAAEREIGLPSEALAGRLFEDCVSASTAEMLTERYAVCVETKTPLQFDEKGEMSPVGDWYRTTLSPCLDPSTGSVFRILTICQNITQTKCLAEAAFEDVLTSLPNRRGFERSLSDLCAAVVYTKKGFAIVVVDLDDLKGINDIHGHRVGDEAIRSVGALLKDFVRTGEVVARVGGDEFYLVLDEPDRESLDLRIHALHNATRDFRIGAVSLSIGLSAGGAVWNLGDDTDEVLSRADAEMYATKAVAKLAGTRQERILGADIEAISETRRR